MVWKLTKAAEGREPLPGVPWRDMDDDEFKEAAKVYGSMGDGPKALENSGYFEHVADKPEKKD